ncbi:MAG: sugar ABC transporter permease, partial [Rhodospirillaceae bacterium]|nr:sugar ABC transporter permease [Rhodospirillaceae bacterium]
MTAGKRPARRSRLAAIEPWLYLSPAVVLLALVMFVPLVVGLSYAFRSIQLFDPFNSGWVGFAHFVDLAHDPAFWHALFHTGGGTGESQALQ